MSIYFLLLISFFCYAFPLNYDQLRDPFQVNIKQKKVVKKKHIMLLEGIMYIHAKRSAVVSYGGVREILERGGLFKGHTLKTIGRNYIVLTRGAKKMKLYLE